MFVYAVIFYFIRNPSSRNDSSVSFIIVLPCQQRFQLTFVNTKFLVWRIWCRNPDCWLMTRDKLPTSFPSAVLGLRLNYWIMALKDGQKRQQRDIGNATALKNWHLSSLAIWKVKRLSPPGELVSQLDQLRWLHALSIRVTVQAPTGLGLRIPRLATLVTALLDVTAKGATAKGKQGGGRNLTWHVFSRQSALRAGLLLQQMWEDGVCSLGGEDLRLET